MRITMIPKYLANEAIEGYRGYLGLHQDPKVRGWHHAGAVSGAAVGIGLTMVGVPPEGAVPAGIAAVYACAIPSHRLEGQGKTAGTLQELGKIRSISDVPRKIGKVLFYMFCEPTMTLMACTGTLKPVMRKLGLNPSGANKVETPLQSDDKDSKGEN